MARIIKVNFSALIGEEAKPEKTISEYFNEFILKKQADGLTKSTIEQYKFHFGKFVEYHGEAMDYEKLTTSVVEFFAAIPNTSPARYNKPYAYLSCFFNYCVDEEVLPKNPIKAKKLHKRKDDGNIHAATIEDINIFLNSFDLNTYRGLRNYVIITLMLDTGIRTSELCRLRNDDFNPKTKTIYIDKQICKTKKNRILYLSDKTCSLINKFVKVKPNDWEDFLFPNADGKELRTSVLTHDFYKMSNKLGVKITPYQLRHSFATYFVEQGGNLFTLQHLMGHSTLQMTERYTDIAERDKREQHSNFTPLNELFTEAPKQESKKNRLVKII